MSADPESTAPTEGGKPPEASSTPDTAKATNGSGNHASASAAPETRPAEAAATTAETAATTAGGAEKAEPAANGTPSAPPAASFPSFPPPGSIPSPSASVPPPSPPPNAAAGAPSGKPPPKPAEAEAEGHAMTLWEHLDELRSRIVRMILAFVVGGVVSWVFRDELLVWLSKPFIEAWPKALPGHTAETAKMHFSSPAALFIAYVRLSAMGGLVGSLPFILYQVWAFIAPGLYSREKRFAVPFVVSSCALFGAGAWFGWRFAFPAAFQFLLGLANTDFGPDFEIKPTLMVGDYIEFVTHMLLAFGFMSELPILVFFLSIAGIVNHTHLIKFFRYFIVVAFVAAAILTPPDPMSQLLLAIPLIFLYAISILVAWVFGKKDLTGTGAPAAKKT